MIERPSGKFSGKSDSHSVDNLASSVFDNGRRGAPKPGCDCVQCFGYCLVDQDEAMRARFEGTGRVAPAAMPLNFQEDR